MLPDAAIPVQFRIVRLVFQRKPASVAHEHSARRPAAPQIEFEEIIMMRKLILACAAVTALGAAAFTPSAASAHGWRGGHGWHGGGFHRGWGGPRFIGGPVYFGGGYGGCYVRRLVPTPWGYRYRLVNHCY
jgi:hypothetical protein